MTNPIAEVIRVLRDTSVPRHESEHVFYIALASALEELDERTRGDVRGEVPEPLPEVLPVGTRATGGDGTRWVAESEVTWDGPNAKRYTGMWRADEEDDYSECGIDQRCIDWAHWRATHSPPPNREGEALPSFRNHRDMGHPGNQTAYLMWTDGDRLQGRADDQDLAACLAAMPEERRDALFQPYMAGLFARIGQEEAKRQDYSNRWLRAEAMHGEQSSARQAAEQRAEAAESRLVELEERHDVERETWYATNVRHAGELEAARARAGAALGLLDEARHELVVRDRALPDAVASLLDCVMLALKPTPSAPTPAVVEKRQSIAERNALTVGELVGLKESPPRDSGGETTGAKRWDTGKDRWTHGEKMPGDWHKFLGPCPSCGSRCFNYGGGWRCLGQYCCNSASNPAPNVGPIPWWWETDIQVVSVGPDWEARGLGTWAQGGTPEHAVAVLRAAKERTHEQREGQAPEAESRSDGAAATTRGPEVAEQPRGQGTVAAVVESDREPAAATPGLTPEEAEEGARCDYVCTEGRCSLKCGHTGLHMGYIDEAAADAEVLRRQLAARLNAFAAHCYGGGGFNDRVAADKRTADALEKAHAEGAKAAKAEGGGNCERCGRHVVRAPSITTAPGCLACSADDRVATRLREIAMLMNGHHFAHDLESLAAELEKR